MEKENQGGNWLTKIHLKNIKNRVCVCCFWMQMWTVDNTCIITFDNGAMGYVMVYCTTDIVFSVQDNFKIVFMDLSYVCSYHFTLNDTFDTMTHLWEGRVNRVNQFGSVAGLQWNHHVLIAQ